MGSSRINPQLIPKKWQVQVAPFKNQKGHYSCGKKPVVYFFLLAAHEYLQLHLYKHKACIDKFNNAA